MNLISKTRLGSYSTANPVDSSCLLASGTTAVLDGSRMCATIEHQHACQQQIEFSPDVKTLCMLIISAAPCACVPHPREHSAGRPWHEAQLLQQIWERLHRSCSVSIHCVTS